MLVGLMIQSKSAVQPLSVSPRLNALASAFLKSSAKGSIDWYVRQRAATALRRCPSMILIFGKLEQVAL